MVAMAAQPPWIPFGVASLFVLLIMFVAYSYGNLWRVDSVNPLSTGLNRFKVQTSSDTSLPKPNKKDALDEDAFLSTRSGT